LNSDIELAWYAGYRVNWYKGLLKVNKGKTVGVDNGNQIAILQAMLNHIRTDDPGFRSFIRQKIIENRNKQKQQANTKEIIRRLRIQNKKLMEQVALLKEQLNQNKTGKNEMQARLNQLIKLNNSLSGALGSCSTCWGEDPDCSNCSGNGSAGWRNTNRRLFNVYVLPTLTKLYGLSGKITLNNRK